MLAKLQTTDLRHQIHERDGIAIYGFIDDHVGRVINRMKNYWVHQSPCYFLNSEGYLESNGTFNTARPILYYLYGILRKSHTLHLLPIDFPINLTDDHLKLTVITPKNS
jgi:hypothetical protein